MCGIATIGFAVVYTLISKNNYGNELSTNLGFLLATFIILLIVSLQKLIPEKEKENEKDI